MYRNHEGYPAPTEGAAIREADKQPAEVSQAVEYLRGIASLMGYEISNRIWLKDKKTGREWR